MLLVLLQIEHFVLLNLYIETWLRFVHDLGKDNRIGILDLLQTQGLSMSIDIGTTWRSWHTHSWSMFQRFLLVGREAYVGGDQQLLGVLLTGSRGLC